MNEIFGTAVFLLHAQFAIGACGPPNVYSEVRTFGPGCRYKCNCVNNEPCDNVTGDCVNGCARGWMGPGCQYRNIATNGWTDHNPPTNLASEAPHYSIDGDVTTCSKTGSGFGRRWLQINLKSQYNIVGLIINVPSGDVANFRGFTVDVATMSPGPLTLCYFHGDNYGNAKMEVNCVNPIVGKAVRISLAEEFSGHLSLCEVSIYGGRLVSFNQPTTMVSTYESYNFDGPWYSSYAVDGKVQLPHQSQQNNATRTCASTYPTYGNPYQSHWWQVDLSRHFSIEAVSFFGRQDNQLGQYRNFIVGSSDDGVFQEIFRDYGSESVVVNDYQPKSHSLTQPRNARVVKILRTGDILVVCEVEIFAECPIGTCGWECQEKCMCSNQTTGTYKIAGRCPHSCEGRWTGHNERCNTECDTSHWGQACENECGNCEVPCKVVDGTCPGSCLPGWMPVDCKQPCAAGKYGKDCSTECGKCREGTTCSRFNGTCERGCQPGYKTPLCDAECDTGTYGEMCANNCSNCRFGDVCHNVNGTCPRGCKSGFQKPNCNTECSSQSFGLNCSGKCGHCRDGVSCNHVSGICISCDPGWETSFCNETCSEGVYGTNCSSVCGFCYNNRTCNHVDGSCPEGCVAGYAGHVCKSRAKQEAQGGGLSTATIGGLAAVVGIAAGIVVIVAIMLKRRSTRSLKKMTAEEKPSSKAEPQDTPEDNETADVHEDRPVYSNISNQMSGSKYIDVSILRDECRKALLNPSAIFQEFKSLPNGLLKAACEAKRTEYTSKNRYKDMCPYNENRVHLEEIQGNPASTYINASYIDGYLAPKKYIATQGPIKTTINDVWRMVWSENVGSIAMLTNCIEQGKMKCMQYWPDSGIVLYGAIKVELMSTEIFTDFIIRTLQLSTNNSTRTVKQFHYTAWPDKDVPDTALSIVQFWRKVREDADNHAPIVFPWLVHCSAGVGRTGTFIATDFLYDQGKAEKKIDIKGTVISLRKQRLKMVQTKDQYLLLHEIITEILDPIGTVCSNDSFVSLYPTLVCDAATNKQKLYEEYQKICKSTEDIVEAQDDGGIYCNTFEGRVKDALSPDNIRKSRDTNIVPEDMDRPMVTTVVEGCNDFINAVYIPTYKYKNRMILTQYPLRNTAIDFIRMIWEFNLTDIVLLENTEPEEGKYWSCLNDNQTIGPFSVETMNETVHETHVLRTLLVKKNGSKQNKEVRQYHLKQWQQDSDIPDSEVAILSFVTAIEQNHIGVDSSSLVVQCLDGAKKSGLFCAVFSVLERVKIDREVAIAETVRLIRVKRRQIIVNFDQYKYIYDVIVQYLQSSDVYANVT